METSGQVQAWLGFAAACVAYAAMLGAPFQALADVSWVLLWVAALGLVMEVVTAVTGRFGS